MLHIKNYEVVVTPEKTLLTCSAEELLLLDAANDCDLNEVRSGSKIVLNLTKDGKILLELCGFPANKIDVLKSKPVWFCGLTNKGEIEQLKIIKNFNAAPVPPKKSFFK